MIESWIDPALPQLKRKMDRLGKALEKMRQELRQKEVAYIIDGKWKTCRERWKKL